MIKPNPFTPKSGLEPKVFINRDKEIDFFLKRVEASKQGNINHYIINGVWGSLAMTKKIKGVPIFLGATL